MTRIVSDETGGYRSEEVTELSVNILGTKYTVKFMAEKDDYRLEECSGYTDFFSRLIVIENSKKGTIHEIEKFQKKVLRHEIVHAFLYESGLATSSHGCESFADDEEIVDWIAIQGEKIYSAWKSAGALNN